MALPVQRGKLEQLFFTALRLSPVFLYQTQVQVARAAPLTDSISSALYETGLEGSFPLYEVLSAPEVINPRFDFLQQNAACRASSRGDDAQYIFVAPHGGVAPAHPLLFDEDGELVWSGGEANVDAYGFRRQQYQGNPVLTYWTGDDQVRGHGSGEYHILDQSYNIIRQVKPGNDLEGDLHEFLITEQNTALMTIYERMPADMSSVGGPVDGKIWDSLFQELDLETNEVLFQWVSLSDASMRDVKVR